MAPACSGCWQAANSPPNDSTPESESGGHADGDVQETWAALFIRGAKAGYQRVRRHEFETNGQRLVHVETQVWLSVARGGRRVEQQMKTTSVETTTGELVEFTAVSDLGGAQQIMAGRVDGDLLRMESSGGGPPMQHSLPWSAGDGGFAAVEESLLREPMQPGQRRTIRHLAPVVYQVVSVQLQAVARESTRLLGEDVQLLRVEAATTLPDGQQLDMICWVDAAGDILKTRLPASDQELIRTTEENATTGVGEANFDLLFDTMVRLPRPLSDPHGAERIRYRVRLRDGDPAHVFSTGSSQDVASTGADSAEVTVTSVRPDRPTRTPSPGAVTAEDRTANHYIQSDDPLIRRLAAEAIGSLSDPWEQAVALERFVHDYMTETEHTQAMATAADAAASRSGDCTEHAVLLAALARAAGIPTRVAIGLVYTRTADGEGFAYHMWNELYIADRWIPMDSTLGRGGIGGGHLKINDSSLAGVDALSAFLPVVQVMGRLEMDVVQVP